MTIAYILDLFPILSETFIVREIIEMKKRQYHVSVFAFRNTSDHIFSEVIHSDTRKFLKEVRYFQSLLSGTRLKRWTMLVIYHLYFLLASPVRYLKAFRYSVCHDQMMFWRFVFSVFYARAISNSRVSHMHVHFALEACTYTMLISMLTGIPYSFTVHAHDIFIPKLHVAIEDKFKYAKFAVCISEFNKQYVLNKFSSVRPDKINIIHCGLNLASLTPNTGGANARFHILSIGRLVEHKGLKYLIEACNYLKGQGDLDFVCNIIGEGSERTELEDLISRFNLTHEVNLAGSLEQSDVIKALKAADLFVLPCVVEESGMMDGIPVSLMESMAMGIPVISTTVSGVPELIKDGAGLLVAPRDAESLAKAMEKILRLPAEKRKEMGIAGRSIIANEFNIEKEADKLSRLFAA